MGARTKREKKMTELSRGGRNRKDMLGVSCHCIASLFKKTCLSPV